MNSVLTSVLMVALVLVLALLFYSFISGFLSFPASEEQAEAVTLVPPQIISASAERNVDNNLTHVCVYVRNVSDANLTLSQFSLLFEGSVTESTRDLYSPDCGNVLPPKSVCTVCTDYPLPEGEYTVLLLGKAESSSKLEVEDNAAAPGWPTDLSVSSISFRTALTLSPPDPNRYADKVFYGEYNAFQLLVTVSNEGNGDAFEATVSASSPKATFSTCTLSVPAEGTATCVLEGRSTGAGELNVTVTLSYALDTNTQNNEMNGSTSVDYIAFCSNCSECNADLNHWATLAENDGVNAYVVLASDVTCTDDIVVSKDVTFDGNGHTFRLVGASLKASYRSLRVSHMDVNVDFNDTYGTYGLSSRSIGTQSALHLYRVHVYGENCDHDCVLVRYPTTVRFSRVDVNEVNVAGIDFDTHDANVEDVNVNVGSGGGVGVILDCYTKNLYKLQWKNVQIHVVDPQKGVYIYTHIAEALALVNPGCAVLTYSENAFCDGDAVIAVTPSNASTYAGSDINVEDTCFVSVYNTSISLNFVGSVERPSAFFYALFSDVNISNLSVTTGDWAINNVGSPAGAHAIVAQDSNVRVTNSKIKTFGNCYAIQGDGGKIELRSVEVNGMDAASYVVDVDKFYMEDVNIYSDASVGLHLTDGEANLVSYDSHVCNATGGTSLEIVGALSCPECNNAGVCACGHTLYVTGYTGELNCPCCEVNTWENCVG